jgi:carboxymethylenebutenolidase
VSGYRAEAREARRGGIVLLPGIEGVAPLTALADSFADGGYEVLIPDFLARFESDEHAADPTALDLMALTEWGLDCIPDIQAAVDALAGPVFALGGSFGGTLAWLAAARCSGLAAASSVSGGHIVRHLDEGLRCPVILHFGIHDPMIPPADVQRIEEAHPHLPVWLYEAGHDLLTEEGDAGRLALLRTRQLFMRSAGKAEMGG